MTIIDQMCEEGTNLDKYWQHALYILYLSVTQSGCRYEKISGQNSDATVLFSIVVPFHGQQTTATAFNASRCSKHFPSVHDSVLLLFALLQLQKKTSCFNIHTPFNPIESSEVCCLPEKKPFFFFGQSFFLQSSINLHIHREKGTNQLSSPSPLIDPSADIQF